MALWICSRQISWYYHCVKLFQVGDAALVQKSTDVVNQVFEEKIKSLEKDLSTKVMFEVKAELTKYENY